MGQLRSVCVLGHPLLPMIASLAQNLSRLLLFKAGPQDLPATPLLLQLGVLAFLTTAVARLLLVNTIGPALLQAVVGFAVFWAYVHLVLRARNKPERFAQTMGALLLSSSVISVLMLPPLNTLAPLLLEVAQGADLAEVQPPNWAVYTWLGLSIWGLALAGHIFRHALDLGLGMGVLCALGYELLLLLVMSLVSTSPAT